MNFNIEVINVSATTKPTAKGSYIQLDVAYRDLAKDKVDGKKIMSFTNKAVYDIMSKAQQGQKFTVTSEKVGEYWQWTNVAPTDGSSGGGSAPSATPAASGTGYASPKSTYETAEERAKRQVLIVRQSSLSSAIETLSNGKALNPEEVMKVAEMYVSFVFQDKKSALPDFSDMADDVPM